MIRIYAIIGLAVSLLVGGLFLWGQEGHQKARSAVAEAKVIATQRDTALESLGLFKRAEALNRELVLQRAAVALAQRDAALVRQRKLYEALKANPGWAAGPVPDGVWDTLPGRPDKAPAPGRAAARLPGPRAPE